MHKLSCGTTLEAEARLAPCKYLGAYTGIGDATTSYNDADEDPTKSMEIAAK